MIRCWKGYSCNRKAGKDLKSNVSDFIKDFCFESGDRFLGADKKKVGKGFGERDFGMTRFIERYCRKRVVSENRLYCGVKILIRVRKN